MPEQTARHTARQAVIPSLRYVDAPTAIDFLCRAFGFERHVVYAADHDPTLIHHAQLQLEGTMMMLGSARPGPVTERYGWKTPAEAGGVISAMCCVVADADAHHARAKAAGAAIVDAPHDNEGYPGRGYAVRDPEGHVWSFGTYDPWAEEG